MSHQVGVPEPVNYDEYIWMWSHRSTSQITMCLYWALWSDHVDCSNKSLREVQHDLPTATTRLKTILTPYTTEPGNNLTILDVGENKLLKFEDEAFYGLSNLQVLLLNDNYFFGDFDVFTLLRKLDITNRPYLSKWMSQRIVTTQGDQTPGCKIGTFTYRFQISSRHWNYSKISWLANPLLTTS